MQIEAEHPYAWLDLDALDYNIGVVNDTCKNKKVRIASKSIRSLDVLRYILNKVNKTAGIMTFTAAETLYLLEKGFNNCLIGYPTVEIGTIKKLLHYSNSGKTVTFMVDCEEHLKILQNLAEEIGTVASICIDINVSLDTPLLYFGTKRSPITNIQMFESFLTTIKKYDCLQVDGLMAYDAQIAGVTDRFSTIGKSTIVKRLKGQSKKHVRSFRQHATWLIKQQYPHAFINAGGSGSMDYNEKQADVTEITVGSAFYAPALFDQYDNLKLKPAAGFACRVVRQFDASTYILQGGGYIASGAVGLDRQPSFVEEKRFAFLPLEGAGEVQSPIIDKLQSLKIGDTVFLRHAKAGELCERFLTLHTFRNNDYQGPFKTYRGDGQCFL